jgi:hypothetical protein
LHVFHVRDDELGVLRRELAQLVAASFPLQVYNESREIEEVSGGNWRSVPVNHFWITIAQRESTLSALGKW